MTGLVRGLSVLTGCALVAGVAAHAQGRGNANWTTAGNDAQRSSWVRTDPKISVNSLGRPGFQLLWKIRLNGPLTPMVVLDPYTGYRGHKSLGYLAGHGDDIYGIDTDLGIVEWHDHLSSGLKADGVGSGACPGGLTSPPARPTSAAIQTTPAGRGGAARANQARGAVGEPGQGAVNPQAPVPASTAPRAAITRPAAVPAVARPNAVYAVTSDGMLRTMYVSDGADAEPPSKFLPPHANTTGLIVVDNVVYAETIHGCGGVPDGVWALDLLTRQVTTWRPENGSVAGDAGPAFGPDGTLYVTAGTTLFALEPKSLKVKSLFSAGKEEFSSSPVVFPLGDKILFAAATRQGLLYLVDSATMTVQDKGSAQSSAVDFVPGALTTWKDATGTRWLLAAGGGEILAWRVEDRNGIPTLEPGWVSSAMVPPATPIIVNGVVFASSGGHLYALDSATGKELWNSSNAIAASPHGGALSAGGSHVYVTTDDGTLYAFGFAMEH